MLSTLKSKGLLQKCLTPVFGSRFSVSATINSNFLKFRKGYDEQVKQFQAKIDELENSVQQKIEKPKIQGYEHPFNMSHHPINFSAVKTAEFFNDFVGPEQVSPHYENFLVSRKYLMAFWSAFFALNFAAATVDLNWLAKSSLIPIIMYTSYLYFYIEGRKAFMKPLLVRFYRRAAANECFMFETYYHENIENKLRENIRITQNQLEYWQVHKSFPEIKAESINNFLANQYLDLQSHLANRSLNILRQAQAFEKANQQRQLQKLVNNALNELEESLKGPNKEKVLAESLESAIEGLSKGFMDYQRDPLLPLILSRVQRDANAISSLSVEEQAKLVELTKEQLDTIRRADQQAKSEFLSKEPELDPGLKSTDTVRKIFQSWGK